jgi:hypothetical protein
VNKWPWQGAFKDGNNAAANAGGTGRPLGFDQTIKPVRARFLVIINHHDVVRIKRKCLLDKPISRKGYTWVFSENCNDRSRAKAGRKRIKACLRAIVFHDEQCNIMIRFVPIKSIDCGEKAQRIAASTDTDHYFGRVDGRRTV